MAVDPIFNFVAIRVALANFVFGLADGGNNFFAVHADGGVSVQCTDAER